MVPGDGKKPTLPTLLPTTITAALFISPFVLTVSIPVVQRRHIVCGQAQGP